MLDYEKRLLIPILGDTQTLFATRHGTLVAEGYVRVVIGGRGPYVEFSDDMIFKENFYVPGEHQNRLTDLSGVYFYHEYRSNDASYVKAYYQRKTVDYADYRIGFWYVSPFDLMVNNKPVIVPFAKKQKKLLTKEGDGVLFDEE